MIIGAVVLGLFSIKRLFKMKPADVLAGLLIGISLFLGFLFQTLGLETTTAGNSAFLTAIYVILVPIMALMFSKQKPTKYNVISAVLMLLGIFFLTARFWKSWISAAMFIR
jgi:drug/metabolite transporter (DMT)-like permease